MMKGLLSILAAAAFLLTTAQLPAYAQAGQLTLSGLSPEATAKVRISIGGFLRPKVSADRSANDLGWDCQAAYKLAKLEVPGARERLASIADELMNDVVRSKKTEKPIGWTASGGQQFKCVPSQNRSGNVDANCEGGERTLYAFQSGLGMACLADAGALLKRDDYIRAASNVMSYWNGLRMRKAPCPQCVYFATSDSAADDMRYVRNMSLFIAFGAVELAGATGDSALARAAAQAIESDVWERRNGNRGYLGKLDPLWTARKGENERIENHAASVALLLNSMGASLADPAANEQAYATWKDWASCDNKRCLNAGCKYWAGNAAQCQATATAAHCAFRLQDPLAREQCETYIHKVKSLGGYGLWALLQARPR
jgi:hypothetical protein